MVEKNSVERAEYMIEQMHYFLKISDKSREEYHQVEIIYNSLLNMLGQTSYKCMLTNFLTTSKKLECTGCLHYKSQNYWYEYLKYVHSRMSTTT